MTLAEARTLCSDLATRLESAHDADEMKYVCSRLRMAIFWADFAAKKSAAVVPE